MAGEVQATFGVAIPVETNAEDVISSLEGLRDEVAQDTAEIRTLQSALKNLQGGTNVNIKAFRGLREQIAAKKVTLAKATEELSKHKNAFAHLTTEQRKATKGTKEYREEQEKLAKSRGDAFASGLAHAIGTLAPRLGHGLRAVQEFTKGFKTMGVLRGTTVALASGIAILSAAAIGAGLAVGFATKNLIAYGVAAADARRDERLMLQAASATLWWGQATETAGKQAQMAVDNVARHVPIARTEVAGYAAQLAKAQLKGQDLQKALKAVSIAASAGQDTSGLIGAFSMARFGAVSVDKLADRIEKKFGGVVAARMLSLSVQTQKLKENFAGLFSKVNVTPFLEGIQRLFSLFSTTTVTGYALRDVFESVFNVLGKDFKSATPILERVFKTFVIGALTGTLMALKFRKAITDFLDQHPRLSKFFTDANTYVTGLKLAFDFLGSTIKTAFGPIGTAIEGLKLLFDLVTRAKPPDGTATGSSFADGIADGITNKAGKVVDAIKDLGKRGIATLKNVWDSHSPSKVAFEIGEGIPEGKAAGVRKAASGAQSAIADALGPSAVPAAGGSLATGKGGGMVVHIAKLVIEIPKGTTDGEKVGRAAARGFLDELGDALADVANMSGATLEVA